jgi:hypothetical protein
MPKAAINTDTVTSSNFESKLNEATKSDHLFKGTIVSFKNLEETLTKELELYGAQDKDYLTLSNDSSSFHKLQSLLSILSKIISQEDIIRRTSLNEKRKAKVNITRTEKVRKMGLTRKELEVLLSETDNNT